MRYQVLRPEGDDFVVDNEGQVADRRALLLLADCVFSRHPERRVRDDEGHEARNMSDANGFWGRARRTT